MEKFAIYGFGAAGKLLADAMLESGLHLEFIIDKYKWETIKEYKNIPIVNIVEKLENFICINCVINAYVDADEIYYYLLSLNFNSVYSIGGFVSEYNYKIKLQHFWLDSYFNYLDYIKEFNEVQEMLADQLSKDHFKSTIFSRHVSKDKYNNNRSYPKLTLNDSYMPFDLPKYKQPLHMIDCGAYNGCTIERFIKSDYKIKFLMAFEPDEKNYTELLKNAKKNKCWGIKDIYLVPNGIWSKNCKIKFLEENSTGSRIDETGEKEIECVSLDETVQHDFNPNIIKFDTEGAEIEALKGGEQLIKKHRPNLLVSIYHKASHLYEIPLLIKSWDLGYKFYIRSHEYNTFGVVLYCLNPDLVYI